MSTAFENRRRRFRPYGLFIQGRVTLQFIVDQEGNVQDPVVLKPVHPLMDAAARFGSPRDGSATRL